jgi:predicted kinase
MAYRRVGVRVRPLHVFGSVLLDVPACLGSAMYAQSQSDPHDRHQHATMFLMVGLPGAGKTTRAGELAAEHRAIRMTPDDWMIPLFGDSMADGKRWMVEGRLISVALQALRLGTNVVLDFGLWGRDERSALRWLAASAGASCQVIYVAIERDEQLARIAHRQTTAPDTTFPISEADVDAWRAQFHVPDAAELAGDEIPGPPAGRPGWPEWAEDHWPTCTAR